MKLDNVRLTAFATAALMIIGGFGTWATAGDGLIRVNGSDRDGAVVIACAAVYTVCLLIPRRRLLILAALVALVAAVTAVVDIQDVESEPLLDAGWGLWLDAASSLVAIIVAVALWRRRRVRT